MKTYKSIRNIFITYSFLFFTILSQAQEMNLEEVQETLQHAVDDYQLATGIVVGIINIDGTEIVAYGNTSIDGLPVDGDTVYEIGSITKVFTSTVLADMVSKGELKLNDPVHLDTRNSKEITLLNLSQQNSGLPRLPNNLQPQDIASPYADYSVQNMYDFLVPTRQENLEIGLNWHISSNYGSEIIWHNGGTGGYRSFTGFIKEAGLGVVVLANSQNSIDEIGFHILNSRYPIREFRRELSDESINTASFENYTGQYQLAPNFIINVTYENDGLFVEATGQPKFPIFAEREHKFFLRAVDAQITFVQGDNNEIDHLILH